MAYIHINIMIEMIFSWLLQNEIVNGSIVSVKMPTIVFVSIFSVSFF